MDGQVPVNYHRGKNDFVQVDWSIRHILPVRRRVGAQLLCAERVLHRARGSNSREGDDLDVLGPRGCLPFGLQQCLVVVVVVVVVWELLLGQLPLLLLLLLLLGLEELPR